MNRAPGPRGPKNEPPYGPDVPELSPSTSYVGRMLGAVPDTVLFIGLNGLVEKVNGEACRLLGFASAELPGMRADLVIRHPEASLPLSGALFERLTREGSLKRLPITLLSKDNQEIPAEANCSLVRDLQGRPQAVVVVARDLRDAQDLLNAKKVEAALRESNAALEAAVQTRTRELERMNAELKASVEQLSRTQAQLMLADRLVAVGTMTAGIAHEINNPLAYVISNMDFIELECPDLLRLSAEAGLEPTPEKKAELDQRTHDLYEALRETRQGVQRVRAVVRGLKIFARDETGAPEPVDVHEALEASLAMAANEIRHRATVVKRYGQLMPIEANSGRIGQVFLNLIINAAQSIALGKVEENQIQVTTSMPHADRVRVEISDTGAGIPQGLRERIFDPFFTTKPVGVGTGLGLSICHGIVTGLGGSLSVESEVGRGSTFVVELPVRGASAGPAQPPLPGAT